MPGRCLECGKELPVDAPDGLCPACLFREVLQTANPDTPAKGGRASDRPREHEREDVREQKNR